MRSVFSEDSDSLLGRVRRALRYQRELGLEGLDTFFLAGSSGRDPQDVAERVAPGTQSYGPLESLRSAPSPSGVVLGADSLPVVRDAVESCRACALSERRTQPVFGSGNPNAALMVVGEAPGRDEDLVGEPFVGKSGHLFERMLRAMGLDREQVYITNVVKCRPPRNRDPQAEEVGKCAPYLERQVRLVAPRVVLALGHLAASHLTGLKEPISQIRGRWVERDGVRIMPTFDPTYLLRNPEAKGVVWDDLQAIMAALGLKQGRSEP